MPLAYFDLQDLKSALEAVSLSAFAFGFLGYIAGGVFWALVNALVGFLRRRGAAAPFGQRVVAAQRRHVLIARALQSRINREAKRLARVSKVGNR